MKYLLLLICICQLCCKSKQLRSINETQYFEGIVEYELNYESNDGRFSEIYLKEVIGHRIEMLFKNGNYRKQIFSSDGSMLREIFLNLNENKTYYRELENDTIYWIDISKNDSKGTFKVINDSIIINEPTTGISTTTMVTNTRSKNEIIVLRGEIHFAKNLKINPLWYSNYLEGNFNEQIKVGKGIQLLLISEGPYWTKSTSAKSFYRKKIQDDEIKFISQSNDIYKEL